MNVYGFDHWAEGTGVGDSKTDEYQPWPYYTFTGNLRPFPQTPKRPVPESIGRPDYADHPSGRSLR